MKSKYYDGAMLLSKKDISGETPEIFICTSNRSAGKTTYFNRLCVNRFLKRGEKFILLYRFNYELSDCAGKFFKDIGGLFFPDKVMESVSRARGIYHELFLDGISCGYALTINNADQIKKLSHFFSDAKTILFDEFQSETNHYCPEEVIKFQSIHRSIARGQGEQVRYVPVYMIANPITILNPYYVALGISERLDDKTRFLRGDGFVLEQGYNEAASAAQKQSGFNRAFKNSTYAAYASEAIYLNDNHTFIERPTGRGYYMATLKYMGAEYGIRQFPESGIIYCDNRPDKTHKMKITVTTEDHQINYVMLKRNDILISSLRYYFEHGCFRFKTLKCKEAILKTLSY